MNESEKGHKDSIAGLVKGLFVYIDEARNMTEHDRSLKGDYKNNPDLHYPQTRSEYLVDKILTLLVSNDWVNGEDEPILDEMCSLASLLDMGVDRPEVWQDLFRLADELKNAK